MVSFFFGYTYNANEWIHELISDISCWCFVFFQYVGTEFICAVQPILKDKWTPELEQAWKVKDMSSTETMMIFPSKLMSRLNHSLNLWRAYALQYRTL